jgi:hypothetical protein
MTTINKLSARDVIDIRRLHSLGESTAQMAESYGVTQRTIQRIITGEIWSSIPEDKTLKGYNGNYEVTADGRIWSNTKRDYLDVRNGAVRLTHSGKKTTLDITDIMKTYFAA